MELYGAEIVLECLKEEGVDTIFGYPGGAVIPLYDALYKYKEDFKHVLTCHEQGASHAADGYSRSTGKVGVCFATSGPGATNTVTGIATAYMDSVPMVVITGQVPSALLGRDSFQEVDITAITLPITKHNYLVKRVNDLPGIIKEAFEIAKEGRPGPVLIDIPKDIFMTRTQYVKADRDKKNQRVFAIDSLKLEEVARLINEAENPVIYAGGGVSLADACEELLRLAEHSSIPVVNTLMGLGGFPRNHPLSLGLVGMHGLKQANLAVTNSDLVLAIGARFSDRVTGKADQFAPKAKVIQIDIDKAEIGKNKEVYISLVGNVEEILRSLMPLIEKNKRESWLETINGWKCSEKEDRGQWVPENILKCAFESLGEDTIVTTEVGQHQMWTAQYWKFQKPRTFLSSGGLGTMGYGLGAAIGAQVGNPSRRVLHIAGDGSFRMNCNELATVARNRLPLITLLFNNSTLGMVRQWQGMFCEGRYSETDMGEEVDYVRLAEAYGLNGEKVTDMEELKSALLKASKQSTATVIECVISKDQKVFPMVPAGMPIDCMVFE